MRHCNICNRDLEETEFGILRSRPDGKSRYCKSCIRKQHVNSQKRIKDGLPKKTEIVWPKDNHKRCSMCMSVKPFEEFNKSNIHANGVSPQCKTCHNSYNKRYNGKKYKESDWERYIFSTYKISKNNYEEMFNNQSGMCAICNGDNSGKRLCIDHDHKSGLVRGLLCSRCNRMLGYALDKKSTLIKAVKYLDTFGNNE